MARWTSTTGLGLQHVCGGPQNRCLVAPLYNATPSPKQALHELKIPPLTEGSGPLHSLFDFYHLLKRTPPESSSNSIQLGVLSYLPKLLSVTKAPSWCPSTALQEMPNNPQMKVESMLKPPKPLETIRKLEIFLQLGWLHLALSPFIWISMPIFGNDSLPTCKYPLYK